MAHKLSWKRAAGVEAAEPAIAKTTGIPAARSGRQRKIRPVPGVPSTQGPGLSVAVLLPVATVLVLVGILRSPTIGAELLPVPTGAELAKAEKTVQEVFGDDLKAAKTPKEKTELAQKMLETAAGSRPTERYALLVQARELAIAAGDAGVGVQAVADLVDGFAPQKRQDARGWAREGHRLWNQASDHRPPEKLRTRLAAAECYLRCLDGLEGFQRTAVEKRLRELGWKASCLSLADALQFFGLDRTAWKVDGDCLRGTLGDLNTADGWAMGTVSKPSSAIDFGFSMKAPSAQCIRIEIDGTSWAHIRGSHRNSRSSSWRGRDGHWSRTNTLSPGIDPPEAWHQLSVRLGKAKVTFFFDGEPVQEIEVAPAGVKPKAVRVGFSRHGGEVRVKDFHLTVDGH